MKRTLPGYRFRAMWPVADTTSPAVDLMDEAVRDLPDVARRHGLQVVDHRPPVIVPGTSLPGSGGAAHVVIIDARVVRIRDMANVKDRAHLREAS